MSFFFGLVTALAIAAYGIYWYTLQPKNRLRQRLREMPRVPRSRSTEFPPLLPPETAARLMQAEPEPTLPSTSEALVVADAPDALATIEEFADLSPETVSATPISADEESEPPAPDIDMKLSEEEEPSPPPEMFAPEPSDDQQPVFEVQSKISENSEGNEEAEPQAENLETNAAEEIVGHCTRCRAKRVLLNPQPATTKRGKPGVRGQCAICGAGIFVFVSEKR